ncbi:MAG: GAF domain-containing protein [Armatimonadetes bacterium]|nr:GAF domain-containing protein [Anaerolineae bacterium]
MLSNLNAFLFNVSPFYDNPIDRQRARGLLILTWVTFVLSLFALPFVLQARTTGGLSIYQQVTTTLVPIVCLIVFLLLRRGSLNTAAWLFLLIEIFTIGTVVLSGFSSASILLLMIPVVSAGSILDRRGLLAATLLLMVFVILGALAQSRQVQHIVAVPAERWSNDLLAALIALTLSALFMLVFNGLLQRVARDSLKESRALRLVAGFTSSSKAETEETVYMEAINFTRTQLNYPFAQLFYTGSDGKLSRRLRISLGIRTLNEQRTDVTIAEGSAIDQAATTRQVVNVSLDDAALRWSHFLPSSTFGVAVPIVYRDEVLGVLDIQTDRAQRFNAGEIQALRTLTDAAAALAAQLRLVAALQLNIREQTLIATTLQARLQELITTTGGKNSTGWEAYVAQRGEALFGFDYTSASGSSPAVDLPEALRPVLEAGALQMSTHGDIKTINVPITLRGEILGAMSFSVPKDRVLTERQIDTAQIVATRLALALENKRLFEQSQAQALRERRANEATNLLISATNVEAVMNVAAASFNDALGAISTRIHLQPSLMTEPESKELVR